MTIDDEMTTARLGATADLVYLLDAARHHLEATEELAAVKRLLEATEEPDTETNLWNRIRSLEIQADALRGLHRKTLNNFLASRPGPAELEALDKLEEYCPPPVEEEADKNGI